MDLDDKWSNECHCKPSANLKPLERRRRREHQRCLAHSLVGTPNYIAPEVLLKTGELDNLFIYIFLGDIFVELRAFLLKSQLICKVYISILLYLFK